jgi:hypothetical protein
MTAAASSSVMLAGFISSRLSGARAYSACVPNLNPVPPNTWSPGRNRVTAWPTDTQNLALSQADEHREDAWRVLEAVVCGADRGRMDANQSFVGLRDIASVIDGGFHQFSLGTPTSFDGWLMP